jgi:hypothetical protein
MAWMPLSSDGLAIRQASFVYAKAEGEASIGEAAFVGVDVAKNVRQVNGTQRTGLLSSTRSC